MKITLDLSDEDVVMLAHQSEAVGVGNAELLRVEERARLVLLYLVDRVRNGVRRPGSWERGVLFQLFGDVRE